MPTMKEQLSSSCSSLCALLPPGNVMHTVVEVKQDGYNTALPSLFLWNFLLTFGNAVISFVKISYPRPGQRRVSKEFVLSNVQD